jgi:hypothetical protein
VIVVESLSASSPGVITTGTMVRPVRAFSTCSRFRRFSRTSTKGRRFVLRYMRILSEYGLFDITYSV